MLQDENYAVVFSGGGALGAWEVGCLRTVIERHGCPPSVVTGASAGALNAAGFCAGMTITELSDLWAELTDKDVYKARPFRGRLVRCVLDGLLGKPLLESVGDQLKALTSLLDTEPLNDKLRQILAGREHEFLSSPTAFAISLTLLAQGEPEFFYKLPIGTQLPSNASQGPFQNAWRKIVGMESLLQALGGTTALPLLFPPMEGRFDGGVLMNQPISPAIGLGATNLYVFIPSAEALGRTDHLLAIGSSLMSTWLSQSLIAQIERIKLRNDIRLLTGQPLLRVCVVRPSSDLGRDPGVNLLSFGKKVRELIELGAEAARDRMLRFDPNNQNTWY